MLARARLPALQTAQIDVQLDDGLGILMAHERKPAQNLDLDRKLLSDLPPQGLLRPLRRLELTARELEPGFPIRPTCAA